MAGRHLRDKHPDIYAQVLNEEADRRNRKRAAEVGVPNSASNTQTGALSDGSYSPPSSNPLDSPQPLDQQIQQQTVESQFKRFKFDEDLFTRMGINLHHFGHEPQQVLLPQVDSLNFIPMNGSAFQFKQGLELGKFCVKFGLKCSIIVKVICKVDHYKFWKVCVKWLFKHDLW